MIAAMRKYIILFCLEEKGTKLINKQGQKEEWCSSEFFQFSKIFEPNILVTMLQKYVLEVEKGNSQSIPMVSFSIKSLTGKHQYLFNEELNGTAAISQ